MADASAEQKIRAARGRLAYLRPYFDHAIFSLILVEAPRCPTIAVDRWKRLYYSPAFVHQLSIESLVPVLLHELGHVLREHHRRGRAMGVTKLTAAVANIAQDCELNDDLRDEIAERKDMPQLPAWKNAKGEVCTAWLPEKIGAEDHQLWEAYYQDLLSDMEVVVVRAGGDEGDGASAPDGSDGQDGTGGSSSGSHGNGGKGRRVVLVVHQDCGSGAHGVQREWEHGDPNNAGEAEGVLDADWEDVKQITAEKIAERQKSRGDVPAGWAHWANDLLRPRRVPWDHELSGGLRWALNDVAGLVLHSYKRPSRRSSATPDIIQPSLRRPKPFVCIVGDTSGSMSDKELALVRGVVEDIALAMGAEVAFLSTDAKVHGGVQKVASGRRIELKGRGGTNMAAGIQYAIDNLRPRPDVIVVVTDCDTPWPERRPARTRVIVCGTGHPSEELVGEIPKWARYIAVDPANTSSKYAND